MKRLGILGGLGPLASARFVSNLYSGHHHSTDQKYPAIVLISDTSFPDRTAAIWSGRISELVAPTKAALAVLKYAGCESNVICCYTLHAVLPFLERHERESVLALPELALDKVSEISKKSLLLCTAGSREAMVFENAKSWERAKDLVVFPSDRDQEEIHDFIYELKTNTNISKTQAAISALVKRYKVESVIFGCTELHLLNSTRSGDLFGLDGVTVVDALTEVTKMIR